jgi:hypothetical protein
MLTMKHVSDLVPLLALLCALDPSRLRRLRRRRRRRKTLLGPFELRQRTRPRH